MSQPLPIQNPFVGRKREQHIYQQLLRQTTPWALIITGDGGLGKSTLLRHLEGQTPQETCVVLLNFANEKLRIDPLNILEELSWKLADDCDSQRVTAFETTLADGRSKLSKLSEQMIQFVQGGDAGTLKDLQLSMSGVDPAAMREQRRQVREMVTKALYAQLLTFQPAHLVLMLDTCEWLNELEGLEVGKWVMDELLPGIHERLAQKHRLNTVVIASRMQPPLTVIEKQDRYPLTLPRLEREAVDLYLQQIGMQDAALRQRVYDITRGHALCVSIIGALWQEQGDRPLTLADLPQLQAQFTEKALIEYIQERLNNRLKTPFLDLTRYGVLLRRFNLPMLQAVFPPEILPDAQSLDIFHQLISYPYIEPLGNQRYAFHDLLREIQASEVREQQPEQWRAYHKRALDYLAGKEPDSPDWYYHAIAYNEEQGMSDWWDAVQVASIQRQQDIFSALLTAGQDQTLKLAPLNRAKCLFWQGEFYRGRYQMDDALQSFEQALGLYRQVGERLGEANALQAIGDVQRFRDEYEAALTSYEQALGLYRQVGSRLGEANVLKAIGDVQQFRKDMQAALTSYAQALGLFRQVGSRLGEANCYLAQGQVALQQEEYQNALTLHTKAYHLYQLIQDNYSQVRLLYYRSFVYEAMGEQQRAIEDIETALPVARSLNLTWILQRFDDLQG